MKHFGLTLLRIAVTAGGSVGAVTLVFSSDASAPFVVLGVALLLVTGALVDRYWVAGLPLAYVVVSVAFDAVFHGTEDYGDMGWWGYAFLFALLAATVSLTLLVGVLLGRAVRRHRGRRGAGSAGNRGVMA